MFEELPASAERADIAGTSKLPAFARRTSSARLNWLAELADERERPGLKANERGLPALFPKKRRDWTPLARACCSRSSAAASSRRRNARS